MADLPQPPDPGPVTIEEIAPNPIKVTLNDSDRPYGQPREVTAFESGGKTDIAEDGLYNPGSKQVVIQVMQPARYRPMVLKGAFRDRLFGVVGHARQMRDSLERIRTNANPVKVTWDGDERQGMLWETKFGEQGPNDITYELTFFVAVDHAGQAVPRPIPQVNTSVDDLAAQMRETLAALKAAQLSLYLEVTIAADLVLMWTAADSAILAVQIAGTALEAAVFNTPRQAIFAAQRVITAAQSAQDALKSLADKISSTRADAAMVLAQAEDQSAWWQTQADSAAAINQILADMRSIKIRARQSIISTTRLYRVQPGDTLESIAQSQLGSRARAGDLAIGASDLVAGQYIRIPLAG